MVIKRKVDMRNLIRELAENKVDALELIREALSNAKDHQAHRVWIRTFKDEPRNPPSLFLIDNGEGMNEERLAAFWGVGMSSGKGTSPIGYKGHGTKLYFACQRLSVATRVAGESSWRLCTVTAPADVTSEDVSVQPLPENHPLFQELTSIELINQPGTAIWIDQLRFNDAEHLLQRRRIESFCDWFTVIGDIRSGLYDERVGFHQAVANKDPSLEGLRLLECELRPLHLDLRINGERDYTPLGLSSPSFLDKSFYAAWYKDLMLFKDQPGLLSLGHRFADKHESTAGAKRVRDDLTALRLTGPADWATEDGYAVVARVEGHRRQRETYLEAQWQNKKGFYGFDERFGLWLCRDFIPLTRRNDLLQEALNRASKTRLQFELNSLRNWQVFINHQQFLPTANRGGISNQAHHDRHVVDVLANLFEKALKDQAFREWVGRMRTATLLGQRDKEVAYMEERRDAVRAWIDDRKRDQGIDPMTVTTLTALDAKRSLLMKSPTSEQELFYLYGLLSGRYRMPLHVLEYNASRGVDAIALLETPSLITPPSPHARVEFKYVVTANTTIDHFFQAIDVIVCWEVAQTGPIYEQSSASDTIGDLQPRKAPLLTPPLDTHQIVYSEGNAMRVIPILEISALFKAAKAGKKRGRRETS